MAVKIWDIAAKQLFGMSANRFIEELYKALDNANHHEVFAKTLNTNQQHKYLMASSGKLFKGKADITVNDLESRTDFKLSTSDCVFRLFDYEGSMPFFLRERFRKVYAVRSMRDIAKLSCSIFLLTHDCDWTDGRSTNQCQPNIVMNSSSN